jgi:hypothetical protein
VEHHGILHKEERDYPKSPWDEYKDVKLKIAIVCFISSQVCVMKKFKHTVYGQPPTTR